MTRLCPSCLSVGAHRVYDFPAPRVRGTKTLHVMRWPDDVARQLELCPYPDPGASAWVIGACGPADTICLNSESAWPDHYCLRTGHVLTRHCAQRPVPNRVRTPEP